MEGRLRRVSLFAAMRNIAASDMPLLSRRAGLRRQVDYPKENIGRRTTFTCRPLVEIVYPDIENARQVNIAVVVHQTGNHSCV